MSPEPAQLAKEPVALAITEALPSGGGEPRPWSNYGHGEVGVEEPPCRAAMVDRAGLAWGEAEALASLIKAAPDGRCLAVIAELLEASRAMANDYQTSAAHHPDHVLVSRAAFEALSAAIADLGEWGS